MSKYEVKVKTTRNSKAYWEDIPVLTTINRQPMEERQDFEFIVRLWTRLIHDAREKGEILEIRYNRVGYYQGHYIKP